MCSGVYSSAITSSYYAFSAKSDHWSSLTLSSQCQACHMLGTQHVSSEQNEITNSAVET